MKTEAERRLDRFLNAADVLGVRVSMNAKEATALFSAIFDPLPEPEPEAVKSFAQLAYEGSRDARFQSLNEHPWSSLSQKTKDWWTNVANIVIAAHEARRPKPTVDEVARVLRDNIHMSWSGLARAVFPLFGVTL